MDTRTSGYTRLTTDGKVTAAPAILYGIYIRSSAANALVAVYDGQDATNGEPVLSVAEVSAGDCKSISLPRPILLNHGIFVDLDADTAEALVFWDPAPRRPPGEEP